MFLLPRNIMQYVFGLHWAISLLAAHEFNRSLTQAKQTNLMIYVPILWPFTF